MHKKNKTEKTPQASLDIEEATVESLNRDQTNLDNETLNSEAFASVPSSWTWKTPGTIQPGTQWSAGAGNTATAFGGPAGDANPTTGAIEASNQYAYTEASATGPGGGAGPFTMESPAFDAGAGLITLTFQVHSAFYSNGTSTPPVPGGNPLVANDGSLQVQGWDGAQWRAVGPAITGTKQVSTNPDPTAAAAEAAGMAYLPSSTFGVYSTAGFSGNGAFTNPDFRFRFRFVKGTSVDIAHYDCAVDNVKIVGPAGAVIDNETLNSEAFASVPSSWTWKTPGTIQPGTPWSAGAGNTATAFGGPAGGANPTTGAIETSNQYAYTEASATGPGGGAGPFTMESPAFDAGAGLITLTFQVHSAFYSNGMSTPPVPGGNSLVANDGSLEVQGWDGAQWRAVGPAITGTKQVSTNPDPTAAAAEAAGMAYLPSSTFGVYSTAGFSGNGAFTNPDFRFRFRFVKGTSVDIAHYDCAVDNVKIVGPAGAIIVQPPPPTNTRTAALATGLGTIFVSPTGNDANNGLTLATAKRTIQAGVNALGTGFVLRIQDGTYREVVTCSNKSGVWIAAENPGKVKITNYWKEAAEGAVAWADLGGGVFRATKPTGNRAWAGHDGTDFLFPYLNEADLRATTITAQDNQTGGQTTVTKPPYGMATNSGGDQIFVRLRVNANPNGRSIFICNDFKKTLMFMNDCDNSIVDGISFEGAGDTQALEWDLNCANPTTRNCTFDLCRHGVRYRSNAILEWNNYKYTGFAQFSRDVYVLDGRAANGTFVLCKGYYNAASTGNISGGGAGNAVLEGSHAMQSASGNIPTGVVEQFCLIDECFDGCRIGDCNDSVVRFCVFNQNRDDCIQIESSAAHPASGIEIRDCYMKQSFRYTSHQEDSINGDAFVHHCVFEMIDFGATPTSSQFIKMISSPDACDAFYYHNLFIIDLGQASNGSFQIWSDFGGATADEIERFYNNIVIIPRELTNGGGPNPKIIENNVVVGPSSALAAFLTANNGVFAGTATANMGLNADYSLKSTSPARNKGRSLISGHPNSVRLDNGQPRSSGDCGPFNFGESPGVNWPRPHTLTFALTVPSRWTSPGA